MKILLTTISIISIIFFNSPITPEVSSSKVKGYAIGDVATDFKLKNIDDNWVSLADFEDAKGFIVIFTCNTCPYSVANEDRINALDKKFKSKGYPVIAINPNNPSIKKGDSFEKMKDRAADKKFTFPYLFDENQEVYPQYGATKTPHVFLLNKEDKGLVVKYIGAIDNSPRSASSASKFYVEDGIKALLAGKDPEITTTKAIGCGIQ